MKRNIALSFGEQASARVDADLGDIPVQLGIIPSIAMGKIAGDAVDFLRSNNVPVTGYHTVSMDIILTHPNADLEIICVVSFFESTPFQERQDRLRKEIQNFRTRHNVLPIQTVKIVINFIYDEAQISD